MKKSARPVADGCYGADHRRSRLNRLIPKGKVKARETSARQETSSDLWQCWEEGWLEDRLWEAGKKTRQNGIFLEFPIIKMVLLRQVAEYKINIQARSLFPSGHQCLSGGKVGIGGILHTSNPDSSVRVARYPD